MESAEVVVADDMAVYETVSATEKTNFRPAETVNANLFPMSPNLFLDVMPVFTNLRVKSNSTITVFFDCLGLPVFTFIISVCSIKRHVMINTMINLYPR